MPRFTGLKAVLANPAVEALTPEMEQAMANRRLLMQQKADLLKQLQEMDEKLGQGSELMIHDTPLSEIEAMVREAMDSPEGTVIAFFPRTTTGGRMVASAREVRIKSRGPARFAVHYLRKSPKTQRLWYRGASFSLADIDTATALGVSPGDLVCTHYNFEDIKGQGAE